MVNQTIQIFARLKPTKGNKGVSRETCAECHILLFCCDEITLKFSICVLYGFILHAQLEIGTKRPLKRLKKDNILILFVIYRILLFRCHAKYVALPNNSQY